MKKLFLSSLLTLGLSSQVLALECSDFFGTWRGNLDGLSDVTLIINNSSAQISFKDKKNQNLGFQLQERCSKDQNGTPVLDLVLAPPGRPLTVYGNAKLTNKSQINFILTYSGGISGSGHGTLNKN